MKNQKRLLLVFLSVIFIFCLNGCLLEKDEEEVIQVKINSLESINILDNSTINFKLWGYDANVADVSATLLNEYSFNLDKDLLEFELNFEEEWNEKIEFKSNMNNYAYYISFEVEIEGEAYELDYKNTDEKLYSYQKNNIEELSGTYYIKKKEAALIDDDKGIINVRIDSMKNLEFSEGAKVKFEVWEYSPLADYALYPFGNLIKEYSFDLNKLPSDYKLEVEKDLINYNSRNRYDIFFKVEDSVYKYMIDTSKTEKSLYPYNMEKLEGALTYYIKNKEINIDLNFEENVNFSEGAKIKFKLLGYDNFFSKDPKSLLQEYSYDINDSIDKFDLEYTEDLSNKIKEFINENNSIFYKLSIEIEDKNKSFTVELINKDEVFSSNPKYFFGELSGVYSVNLNEEIIPNEIINIKVDSIDSLNFSEGAKVKFQLWEYSHVAEYMSFPYGQMLKEYSFDLKTLPSNYNLEVEKEVVDKINDHILGHLLIFKIEDQEKEYMIDIVNTDKVLYPYHISDFDDDLKTYYIKNKDINISIDSKESIEFSENAKIKFKLWAYDGFFTKEPKLLLQEKSFDINKISSDFNLGYTLELDQKIKEFIHENESIFYHMTFEIEDSENNFIVDTEMTNYTLNSRQKYFFGELSGTYYIEKSE